MTIPWVQPNWVGSPMGWFCHERKAQAGVNQRLVLGEPCAKFLS